MTEIDLAGLIGAAIGFVLGVASASILLYLIF